MSTPASSPGTRRTSLEDVRREELIAATLRVISERGFDSTTVRDIAHEAGASLGSVNYYFKSKDELLRVAVAESDRQFRIRVREVVGDTTGAAAKLDRVAELCFPAGGDGPDWAVFIDFWQQASRHDSFRAIFEAANAEWIEFVVGVMTAGVAAGELVIPGSIEDEAMALTAMIDGLALHSRVTQHIDAATACRLVKAQIDQLRR